MGPVWEAVNLGGQEGVFWRSLMAGRGDLLGSEGREHIVTAGVHPPMPTQEMGSGWQLPPLKAFDYFNCD